MEGRGGVLMVTGFIFAALVLIIAGTGIYFYNFYVFEEVRVCIGEIKDTSIPCMVQKDCLDVFNISLDVLEDSPEFVKMKVGNILERTISCEGTCFVRITKGINFESGELEGLGSCGGNEEEILMEIRGKEGLEVMKWMKNRELQL